MKTVISGIMIIFVSLLFLPSAMAYDTEGISKQNDPVTFSQDILTTSSGAEVITGSDLLEPGEGSQLVISTMVDTVIKNSEVSLVLERTSGLLQVAVDIDDAMTPGKFEVGWSVGIAT